MGLKQAGVQALYSFLMQLIIWSGDLSFSHMRHVQLAVDAY